MEGAYKLSGYLLTLFTEGGEQEVFLKESDGCLSQILVLIHLSKEEGLCTRQ